MYRYTYKRRLSKLDGCYGYMFKLTTGTSSNICMFDIFFLIKLKYKPDDGKAIIIRLR